MKVGIALLTLVALVTPSRGEDQPLAWPRFRGPNGSGIVENQKPPVEIGPEKNLKWKVTVPSGLSSPIIAGDKLLVTALENGKLYTIAYNRADGMEVWRKDAAAKTLEPFHKTEGSPASSTPVTDGERIVSYFGSCGFICYNLSGKELWRYEMPPVAMPGAFGSAASPILVDGVVVVVRDQLKEPMIVAVDATTGLLKWECKRQSVASYSTPVVWDTPEGKQIVASGHGRMIGYDLKDGAEKWWMPGMPSGCCTSPVTAGAILYFAGWSPGGPDDVKENQMPSFDAMLKDLDKDKDGILSRAEAEKAFEGFFDAQDTNKDGKISREEYEFVVKFMTDGVNSAFALKPGGSGDVSKSQVLWTRTKGLPYLSSAIHYHGQYVMVKDGGIVTAIDAKSGKELYMERAAAGGKYYASPVAANGNIYFTALEDGTVTVLMAGTYKPVVVAKNPKLGERVAATPAIADDTIYIRSDKHLYAFGVKK